MEIISYALIASLIYNFDLSNTQFILLYMISIVVLYTTYKNDELSEEEKIENEYKLDEAIPMSNGYLSIEYWTKLNKIYKFININKSILGIALLQMCSLRLLGCPNTNRSVCCCTCHAQSSLRLRDLRSDRRCLHCSFLHSIYLNRRQLRLDT